jgi:hypothetical protein
MAFQYVKPVGKNMSNDIIASLKSELANIQSGVDDDTRAVAGGSGNLSKRISIKGGVFRKMAGGKEIGSIEDRYMNVIFVKMAHNPSRTYYTGAYKEGEKIAPVCWSSDSKTPDPEVKSPQASSCDSCQWSVKGSGQGGSGTACRLSWRTAVVLPQDPGGDVMQLVLPATSCFGKEEAGKWPFRPYIQMLANNNISAGRVVTKMQFDTKSPVPKLLFSPAAVVPESDAETIKRQKETKAADSAVKLTVYQQDEGEAPEAPITTGAAALAEPIVRETKKAEDVAPTADVSGVIKKWSKKS